MPAVAFPIPTGHRLGVEDLHSPEGKWNSVDCFDDLDFADDLALFSHTQRQMQEKTSMVENISAHLGLRVHRDKSKILKNNTAASTAPITRKGD